jgi:large subunit ribosomal protein L30e
MDVTEDIRKAMTSGKAIVGSKQVIEHVKKGTLEKAFLASNIEPGLKDDLVHYAKISGVELVMTEIPRDEFGTLCKKPFPISVLGLAK